MKIKELKRQIDILIKSKYISDDDEVIILGTGDRATGFLDLGFCMPAVTVDLDKMLLNKSGHYGLGCIKM